jgi:integrase
MITINYYLKGAMSDDKVKQLVKSKTQGIAEMLNQPLQLYLMISGAGKRIQIYTQKRISQYEWDKHKQRIDTRKNKLTGEAINDWLHSIEQSMLKKFALYENEGMTLQLDDIRDMVQTRAPIIINNATSSMEQYFKRFIQEHKTGQGYSKKHRTVQNYNAFFTHLKKFSIARRIPLIMDNFTKAFLIKFKDYLSAEVKLGDNTVSKYIKTAKTFVRFYINEGLIKPFPIAEVKSTEKDGEIYIITLKQLIALQNYKIDNKRLDGCRDLFCFQCWTGQRFSDIETFKIYDIKTNQDGDKTWDLYTKKTGENIKVPIVEYALNILDKYADSEFHLPLISLQKQNQNLKELGELVSKGNEGQAKIEGFDTMTKIVEYHDGIRKETYVPFFNLLTTHVARKSYITNSLIIGIPERVVKEVSGHKSEKDFRRYVNLASSYKDEVIRRSYSTENIAKFIK